MRKFVTVALCALACAKNPASPAAGKGKVSNRNQPSDVRNAKVNEVIPHVPQFMDRASLSTEVGPDGKVTKETKTFQQGQPVYFTLVLRESPPVLQTSAVWMTHERAPLRTERKEMNGGKVAVFVLKDAALKPGHSRVVGYWGGNIAADRDFEIVSPAKAKKAKG